MKQIKRLFLNSKFVENIIFIFLISLISLISDSYAFNPFVLVILFLSYNRGINTYICTVSFNIITSFIVSVSYGVEIVIVNALFFLFCLLMCMIKTSYSIKKYMPFIMTHITIIILFLIKFFSWSLFINLLLEFALSSILLYGYNSLMCCINEKDYEFDNRAKVIVLSSFSLIFFGIQGFYLVIVCLIHLVICKISSSIIGALSLILNCLILYYLQNFSYNSLICLIFPSLIAIFINKKYVSFIYLVSYVFINAFVYENFYTSMMFYQGLIAITLSIIIPKKVYDYLSELFLRADNRLYLETEKSLNIATQEINNIISYLDVVLASSLNNQYMPEEKLISAMKEKICIECSNKGTCELFTMLKESLNTGLSSSSRKKLFDECYFPYKIVHYLRIASSSLKNEKKLIDEIRNTNALYQKEIEHIYRPLRNLFNKTSILIKQKSYLEKELEKNKYVINNLSINNNKISFEISLKNKQDIYDVINVISSTLNHSYYLEDLFFVLSINMYKVELSSDPLFEMQEGIISYGLNDGVNGDSYLSVVEKDHYYLLLSDGVGHNKDSSSISFYLVNALSCYRKIEDDVSKQISNVNALLKSKVDEEKYATLDYIDINLVNGEMKMYKCGSFNSYLYHQNTLYKFKSNTPPIGILYDVNTEPLDKELIDNDILICMSDGYSDNPEDILLRILAKSVNKDSNQIAKELNEAFISENLIEDDKTLIVLKIRKINKRFEGKNVGISLKKI